MTGVEPMLAKLAAGGGPFLVGAILIGIMIWKYKILWKEHLEQQKEFKREREEHKEEQQNIVKQMFEVVNRNTESNTRLYESIRDLSHTIHINSSK